MHLDHNEAAEIQVGETLGALVARTECVTGPKWQVSADLAL